MTERTQMDIQAAVDELARLILEAEKLEREAGLIKLQVRQLAKKIYRAEMVTSDRKAFVSVEEEHAVVTKLQTPDEWRADQVI